jgi:protein disulfide-isomerase A6
VIAKTDADGVGRELGSRYGVTGFPSESTALHFYASIPWMLRRIDAHANAALKWFPAGSTEAVDCTGGRDLDSLAAL